MHGHLNVKNGVQYGATAEWYWQGKTDVNAIKLAPASNVTGRLITAEAWHSALKHWNLQNIFKNSAPTSQ